MNYVDRRMGSALKLTRPASMDLDRADDGARAGHSVHEACVAEIDLVKKPGNDWRIAGCQPDGRRTNNQKTKKPEADSRQPLAGE
jgi:hypothetical protein